MSLNLLDDHPQLIGTVNIMKESAKKIVKKNLAFLRLFQDQSKGTRTRIYKAVGGIEHINRIIRAAKMIATKARSQALAKHINSSAPMIKEDDGFEADFNSAAMYVKYLV